MSGNKTKVALEYPIDFEGAIFKELEMRRPTVADQMAADKAGRTPVQSELAMFANLCEVSTDLFPLMDLKDYGSLQEAYTGFLS